MIFIYASPLVARYAIRSFLFFLSFKPAKIILVPGIIFFGFCKYLERTFFVQVIPDFALASVYLYPDALPASRPTTPCRLGPCPCFPSVMEWHWAHFLAKILAPFSADIISDF